MNDPNEIFQILKYISLFCSCLSLFTSLFFILMFFFLRYYSQKLLYKLILFVHISDAIFSFGLILIVTPIRDLQGLCLLQAFFMEFGSISSIMARLVLTILLFFALRNNEKILFYFQEKIIIISVEIFSLIISLM